MVRTVSDGGVEVVLNKNMRMPTFDKLVKVFTYLHGRLDRRVWGLYLPLMILVRGGLILAVTAATLDSNKGEEGSGRS